MNFVLRHPFSEEVADSITRLNLPERFDIASPSVRQTDIELLSVAPPGFMDITHFDTVRFPPPNWALQRFAEAAGDGSLAYSNYRGNKDVLEKVAENVSRFLGVSVDPKRNIILTPGTQSALFGVLSARVNPGQRVAVMDPDYLFTARILRFLGAEVGYVPLSLTNGRYEPDLDMLELEFAKNNAQHLVFSHPNNPTGAVYSKEILNAIGELAIRYGVSICVDELYSRLVYDSTEFNHLAAQDGLFEQTATLLGPSKTESMSGYRLGVVVGDEKLMQAVENILSITSLRAPAYAQHILPYWLAKDGEWLQSLLHDFKGLRELTISAMTSLAWLKVHPQQGTAYLWLDVSALGLPGAVVARALLEKAGVLVSPGYQFGPKSDGHFRVCYARDEKHWPEALDRIVRVLGDLAKRQGL